MSLRTTTIRLFGLFTCFAFVGMMPGIAEAQPINVITVDCTPFVSPGFSSFGPQLTMGMALQSPLVDPGNVLFNVTEVTPTGFQGMTANQLAAFDLIAINNLNTRLNCPVPDGVGLGTTWHSVVGVDDCGGRVLLNSHDAPRFQILPAPFTTPMSGPCPGCEPFGTDELVRDAALWAGSGTSTGLLIFNDSQGFQFGNLGWNNPELSLPVGWGISDSLQGGGFADGGYTQIVGAFAGHPVYANVNSVRLAPNSISSFAANISDTSFHSIFAPGWNAAIFAASEVVQNANVVDVGGFNAAFFFGFFQAAQGPNGEAISLIRERTCDAGCTLTQGYWKNHNRFRENPSQQIPWPIDEDTLLCGETWLDNLNTRPKGDAFFILAHQWIAAMLNVADGADDSDVAAEIAEAEALLNSCVSDTSDRDRAIELADILADYNEGAIGPSHCDDVENLNLNAASCGLGFELAFLLPPLMWVYSRRKRLIH